MIRQSLPLILTALLGGLVGCDPVSNAADESASAYAEAPIENLHRVSGRVWSGGQPKPDDFRAIRDLGVTTVISVDGATPDLQHAHEAGLRYIHIPIGYDGISNEAAATLREALTSTDEPVYIHCHHGKHRGPAMAAIALMLEGEGDHSDAKTFMTLSGTSPGYTGLWRDVAAFNEAACSGIAVELHEVMPIDGFTDRMAQLDRTWDNIKLIEKAGWSVPPDHPDIDPPHEALMLLEHLREAAREVTPNEPFLARGQRADFDDMMAESEVAATVLHEALRSRDRDKATRAYRLLRSSCTDCHAEFRN